MRFHSINQTRSSILLPQKFKFKVKTIEILQRGMTIAKKVEKMFFLNNNILLLSRRICFNKNYPDKQVNIN